MIMRADGSVTAGLSQVARMTPKERARVVRELCGQSPTFRSLLTQVSVVRTVAFASGLALAVAVVLLAQGAPAWWSSVLVLAGLAGFGSVAVVLTDSRFDLLLAVVGAHRTDELYGRLVTDEIYGSDPRSEVGVSTASVPVWPSVAGRPAVDYGSVAGRPTVSRDQCS